MVFKDRERGRRVVKGKKMDAMRGTLPRLQLTVPMPMKTEKVGLTFRRFDINLHDGKDKKCWQVLERY